MDWARRDRRPAQSPVQSGMWDVVYGKWKLIKAYHGMRWFSSYPYVKNQLDMMSMVGSCVLRCRGRGVVRLGSARRIRLRPQPCRRPPPAPEGYAHSSIASLSPWTWFRIRQRNRHASLPRCGVGDVWKMLEMGGTRAEANDVGASSCGCGLYTRSGDKYFSAGKPKPPP